MDDQTKILITDAKNICLIPSDHETESACAALALFYTLKDLGKNVNLLAQKFPEKLNFLIPSAEFISEPRNFVISIPRSAAEVSQVYYEKSEEQVKIHIATAQGGLKKDQLAFYAEQAKPDLVITLGIQNLQQELAGRLDAFGFLLDAPIINIDNNTANLKFGTVNMVEDGSLVEIILDIIRSFGENHIVKAAADCLTAGLAEYLAKHRI